jgi:hypothetical protein
MISTLVRTLSNPPRTEGLTTLDRDRASSIADEGGTSAAAVEAQRPPTSTRAAAAVALKV